MTTRCVGDGDDAVDRLGHATRARARDDASMLLAPSRPVRTARTLNRASSRRSTRSSRSTGRTRPSRYRDRWISSRSRRSRASPKITELEEEIATLEQSLEDVTAERDELKAAEGDAAMSNTEFLARLQEKEDRISTLEDQLATATSQLNESQNASQRAADDLRTAQTQLQQANATLTALEVTKIENYVNSDISRIRSDAAAKGWVLVEQRVDSAQAAAGTVTNQQPGPGANVIRGSVVYVEYGQP
jgi:chromosome segregation ATPase